MPNRGAATGGKSIKRGRQWYNTARWRELRMDVIRRDRFQCQICGHIDGSARKLVADHREPHLGDETLFWDDANLWCLCKTCHDSVKQREERGG